MTDIKTPHDEFVHCFLLGKEEDDPELYVKWLESKYNAFRKLYWEQKKILDEIQKDGERITYTKKYVDCSYCNGKGLVPSNPASQEEADAINNGEKEAKFDACRWCGAIGKKPIYIKD